MNTTALTEFFTEKQIQVIKDIIIYGEWGDCDMEFGDNTICNHAFGYFTNLKDKGKYKGKELSGICSGISKKIKENNYKVIAMASDWWGDGTGDMMFLNMDLLCIKDSSELDKWAKDIN